MRKGNQDDFFNERMAQSVDGVIDQDAAIIEGDDSDARGKAGLNLGDLLLDRVDDLASVGAVANDNDAADGFFSAGSRVR